MTIWLPNKFFSLCNFFVQLYVTKSLWSQFRVSTENVCEILNSNDVQAKLIEILYI